MLPGTNTHLNISSWITFRRHSESETTSRGGIAPSSRGQGGFTITSPSKILQEPSNEFQTSFTCSPIGTITCDLMKRSKERRHQSVKLPVSTRRHSDQ